MGASTEGGVVMSGTRTEMDGELCTTISIYVYVCATMYMYMCIYVHICICIYMYIYPPAMPDT